MQANRHARKAHSSSEVAEAVNLPDRILQVLLQRAGERAARHKAT